MLNRFENLKKINLTQPSKAELSLYVNTQAGTVETYNSNGKEIERVIKTRSGSLVSSSLENSFTIDTYAPLDSQFDKAWLTSSIFPVQSNTSGMSLHLADLFSGLGGMSLGVVEAGRALGKIISPKFALDIDKDSIGTYQLNFPEAKCLRKDINELLDGEIGHRFTETERTFKKDVGRIDIVIGGPPCQGNSDLNNHTRRKDPKNDLLLRVVRFAELFKPDHVIIENVQGVRHDKGNVTEKAKKHLESIGYKVNEGLLLASNFGVPQNRRRYFLVATTNKDFDFDLISIAYKKEERSFSWACLDLIDIDSKSIFNTPSTHSIDNQKRINYLFDHDLYELPNSQRPNCHKAGNHSYKSVYGRMYPDLPSPTITSGFGSIGQGRFCHPYRKRSITPHEAARLQLLPDFFRFPETTKRVSYQRMIGNAVPTKLSYIIALELLR